MLIHDYLRKNAERLPDKIALICDNEHLSYRQINDASEYFATSLISLGLQKQDRIIIFLENSVESVIALYGIIKAGCIFVMINSAMKSKKLNFIIRDTGAKAILARPNKISLLAEAIKKTNSLDYIVWCPKADEQIRKQTLTDESKEILTTFWEQLIQVPPNPHNCHMHLPIDIDIATIIYTSGSTGDPKGVVSTHQNMEAAATSIITYLENDENDIVINVLPLSFDYGLYQVIMAFMYGGRVILEKSFMYPYIILERLADEHVTGFPLVPTMAAIILQIENLKKFSFESLRYFTNTAAALPPAYIQKLQAAFPEVKIFSMYGLTECKRVSYLPPDRITDKPDSVGIPIPNEDVFIVDENGQVLEPGQIGELVVRGANVMQGYWNSPEETAQFFRSGEHIGDRLLYTGDLFRQDDEGFLYYIGRKDDLIKSKGERISPKEIENTLCDIEGVAEAAVIGVPDELSGQIIKAFIVVKKTFEIAEDQILRYCKANLEPFMVPTYIEFVNSFPKTSSGKINKKNLN